MVTWNERDDAREAFIAGSSGARRNTGTTEDTRDAFKRGQTSAKEFKRALYQRRQPKDKPQWQQNLDREIKKFGSTVGTLVSDAPKFPKKGIDYLASTFKNLKLPTMMGADAAARALEEDKASSRDYGIPWWKGGNPTAVDRGSAADRYLTGAAPGLTPLIQDMGAYNEALDKDRLFTTNLNEMTGNNYEAKAGYLALLNDPSRLKDMDPIRGLNYMRSITGEPSNMGFDEFEAMRKSQPEVYGGLTATEIAKKLLPQYTQQADEMYGQGFIGNTAAATYGDTSVPAVINQATGVAPNAYYGDRDVLLDRSINAPPAIKYSDKYLDQFDIAEGLSPYQKYLLQSQVQGRGGYDFDPSGAFINAGFDPDYLGEDIRMKITNPILEKEEDEQGFPFYQ